MFNTGTKVIALTSSHKKSQGPRRGSMGYVINNSEGFYLRDMKFAINTVEIMFTRYGLERDEERREKRSFLNIFPIFPIGSGDKVDSLVKEFIREIHRAKTEKDGWKKILRDSGNGEKTPVGVLVPVCDNRINLLECSDNEFIAWLESYLLSAIFRGAILGFIKGLQTRNTNSQWAMTLSEMMHDKNRKKELLDLVAQKHRTDIIKTIRQIDTVFLGNLLRKNNAGYFEATKRTISKYGVESNHFYKTFIQGRYTIQEYAYKDACLLGMGDKAITSCVENIERTRKVFSSLSFPLLRMGKKKELELKKEVKQFLKQM
jgi:hypothetical protein